MQEEVIQNSNLEEKKSRWRVWIIVVIGLVLIIVIGTYAIFQYKVYKIEKALEEIGLLTGEPSDDCSEIEMKPVECFIKTDESYIDVRGEVVMGIPSTMKGIVKDENENEVRGVSKMPILKNVGLNSMPVGALFGWDNIETLEFSNLENLQATVQPGIRDKNGEVTWCNKSNEWIDCKKRELRGPVEDVATECASVIIEPLDCVINLRTPTKNVNDMGSATFSLLEGHPRYVQVIITSSTGKQFLGSMEGIEYVPYSEGSGTALENLSEQDKAGFTAQFVAVFLNKDNNNVSCQPTKEIECRIP